MENYRYGEKNPAAELTDRDVQLMRWMHEREGYSYARLAEIFECSKSQAHRICTYQDRGVVEAKS